jgi:hypothetical protein
MDFKELSDAEKAVIRALQRVFARWPKTLRLISVGGGLTIAYSDGSAPDRPVAVISGVPLGGEWPRDASADRWVYEFTVRRRDAVYARQETAVRLLLHPALADRQRITFTEQAWLEFLESARRCGLSLYDVYRTPVMPSEAIST